MAEVDFFNIQIPQENFDALQEVLNPLVKFLSPIYRCIAKALNMDFALLIAYREVTWIASNFHLYAKTEKIKSSLPPTGADHNAHNKGLPNLENQQAQQQQQYHHTQQVNNQIRKVNNPRDTNWCVPQ